MERDAADREATRFGSSQPNIAKSSGTGEASPHKQANPTSIDINKARKVWDPEGTNNPTGRVADAGDGGQTVPYDLETQSDMVAKQSKGTEPE